MGDGKHSETGKLAQQVKVFVAKTEALSLIFDNFVIGGNQLPKLFSDFHTCADVHTQVFLKIAR